MKFTSFKEFRLSNTIQSVIDYLSLDLRKILKELQLGLTKLNFTDNFDSFQYTITINASEEVQLQNQLDSIPSGYLIIKTTGSEIVLGDTPWTINNVYLKNTSATDTTCTVIFMR